MRENEKEVLLKIDKILVQCREWFRLAEAVDHASK